MNGRRIDDELGRSRRAHMTVWPLLYGLATKVFN
jgi:hypothetical protein